MTTKGRAVSEFHKGEQGVMAEGACQGTTGVFIALRADCAWADITEPNGNIRRHAVAWMAHTAGPSFNPKN